MNVRPFRFAVIREITPPSDVWQAGRRPKASPEQERAALLASPQRAEALGFDIFTVGEHLYDSPDPLIDLMAVASATSSIRLATSTLINDFHNPALLAKRVASLDLFTGGRVELGIGAGYNPEEFGNCGIPFDPAPVRIARLRESIQIVKALFGDEPVTFKGDYFTIDRLIGYPSPVQEPHPPIMIGGGGKVMLRLAAELADIVDILPGPVYPSGLARDPLCYKLDAVQQRVQWVTNCAGPRFNEIELGSVLFRVTVTDDRVAAASQMKMEMDAAYRAHGHEEGFPLSNDEVLASPFFAIGTVAEIVEDLVKIRETLGISHFEQVASSSESFAAVIEALR